MDDLIDEHLEAVLKAAGSSFRHYSIPSVKARLREAMRAAMEAAIKARGPCEGPWDVAVYGDGSDIRVQSHDFKRDIQLRVTGDFATYDEQTEYAERIAQALNAAAHNGTVRVPVEPTEEMIEAGAERLVCHEESSIWPDSFSALQRQAARNDAERVWRSMSLVAKGK